LKIEDTLRAVIAVHRFMPDVLADILRKAPLNDEKVAFAWRASVGPAVDKVTTIELRGRVLHVRAKDATWQREVERSMGIVRSRMEALLGSGVIGDIRITAD
jgi:Dna[CI] antecedent DciA-like protein